jgi:phospholipase/lecithinase/hemolysin
MYTSILLRRLAGSLCLALVLAAPRLASAQPPYSGIVVFGTSLSDPGNAFHLLGAQGTPPDFTLNPLLIPASPYARGGHHFSNGATWIEQYARSLGLAGSVRPAFASNSRVATNFAVGAARAWDDGINVNLTQQVDAFLERAGGSAAPDALYVLEIGGNDVRDAFALYAAGGDGGSILQQALASIASNIQRLYAAGARDFLVWTVPNVGLTPAIASLGPRASGLATQLAQRFNAGLLQTLAGLTSALNGSSFTVFDSFSIMNEIISAPTTFGLSDVATACVTPNAAPFMCQNADEYLFWDGIHPTRSGHAILAQKVAEMIR